MEIGDGLRKFLLVIGALFAVIVTLAIGIVFFMDNGLLPPPPGNWTEPLKPHMSPLT